MISNRAWYFARTSWSKSGVWWHVEPACCFIHTENGILFIQIWSFRKWMIILTILRTLSAGVDLTNCSLSTNRYSFRSHKTLKPSSAGLDKQLLGHTYAHTQTNTYTHTHTHTYTDAHTCAPKILLRNVCQWSFSPRHSKVIWSSLSICHWRNIVPKECVVLKQIITKSKSCWSYAHCTSR